MSLEEMRNKVKEITGRGGPVEALHEDEMAMDDQSGGRVGSTVGTRSEASRDRIFPEHERIFKGAN